MSTAEDEDQARSVDATIAVWHQGDCVLGEDLWLVYQGWFSALSREEPSGQGAEWIEAEVLGLMLTTQTCDIVRSCTERPFVEVCPLVIINDGNELRQIERFERPRYACVPGVASRRLVADLDRTMTVEKTVVARWPRTVGCSTDPERRRLAQALARKRQRTAFPDDFVALVQKLAKRLKSKHGKGSTEGRALRALREIRVRAAPSWSDDEVELTFFFIRSAQQDEFEGAGWGTFLEDWLELVPASGRFAQVDGMVVTLDDLTAREFVESDPLDLDHLSTRSGT